MKNEQKFFDISKLIFWIIAGVIAFMFLPYFKNGFYFEKNIDEWLVRFDTIQPKPEPVPIIDTIQPQDSIEYEYNEWRWRDFEDQAHYIKYKYLKGSLELAMENRLSGTANHRIYYKMYNHDKDKLKDLINQMKFYIKKRNLNYMNTLNYVCSSIQYIPYTLVLNSSGECPCEQSFGSFSADCIVQSDGRGCCSNVDPFGIYSPFEFAYYKTGDCDTRALLAYTILKEMGFDVAVMVSKSEGHSVLGVADIGNYSFSANSFGTNYFGKRYYLWELTSENWRFGMNVEGNDWRTALE
jgi:hypothetical protein